MQKFVQMDSLTWYKYQMYVKLARGAVLGVWLHQCLKAI